MQTEIENIFQKGLRKVEAPAAETKPVKKTGRRPANSFPYEEVFPAEIIALIRELNTVYGFPADFTSAAILVAFSVRIGNSYRLKFRDYFIASAVLYIMLVAPSSAIKSPPLDFIFRLFEQRERQLWELSKKEMEEREKWEGKTKTEREGEAEPPKPKERHIILQDFTSEALAVICDHNKKGVCIHSDELWSWLGNINRYSPSGSGATQYLSMWSGGKLKVIRRTKSPIIVENPFVSIIGGVQNAVLGDLFGDRRGENGFMDRMLPIMPEGLPVARWGEGDVEPELVERLRSALYRLLETSVVEDEKGYIYPTMLQFTPEADERVMQWHNEEHCVKLEQERDATYATAIAKLDIYALRFMLILHLLYWAVEEDTLEPQPYVGLRAVEAAIRLVDFFREEHRKVHAFVYDCGGRLRNELEKKVYEDLADKFSSAEGLEVALSHGMSERGFYRFTAEERGVFKRLKAGLYEKL
ncbi:DUF3987 domain-containing protein [Alistipes sp.]|uniref:DUF3987 domain-containing protein n=1 Tax=Alistipes sp. TaxID=1872444 RepID=UPI003AB6AE5B